MWLFLILGLHIIAFMLMFSAPTVGGWCKQVLQWCKEVLDAIIDIFPKPK